MKKLLLLGFAALLFAACGKDDDNTTAQEEQIRQKLMKNEWVDYGYYFYRVYPSDTDIVYIDEGFSWKFTQDKYIKSYDVGPRSEPYQLRGDSIYLDDSNIGLHVKFAGDSCIFTSKKRKQDNYTYYSTRTLYPKGYK